MLSVHFSFALARHLGQGTDNIRFSVSLWGCTPILFRITNWRDGQFCSFGPHLPKAKTKMGLSSSSRPKVNSGARRFQSAPRLPSLVGTYALKCNEAAC